jgi:tetratricopeptide (TPR) repeat protein
LKIAQPKYIIALLLLVVLIACSTKKDKWVNRSFQSLNTKYNVNFNGEVALDKGILDLKSQYADNFWEILPVERLSVTEESLMPGQKSKNANFDRAEEKATKAIQKRSMNIDGKERNSRIDEAYLTLGEARYYEQRFIPALEAFNYILDKYPDSDKIFLAKIWREKTNMRLENDVLAVKNLKKLLKDIKLKDQIFADANATLSQAFINLGLKDSAIVYIKTAEKFTKIKEEKARYLYIKGQLFETLNQKDSAKIAFQTIVDMKRKSPKSYSIHASAKVAQQFDYEKGDTLLFLKTFDALLADRENRTYHDQLYHQIGVFYDKRNKPRQAILNYNKSLKAKTLDGYLVTSNYKNLATIYFNKAKYQTAGQYYDSTLVGLKIRSKEYNFYKKKRENLADVIKYEGIAQRNDSILNVLSLSTADKKGFYDDYIVKLKKADLAKIELEKKEAEKAKNLSKSGNDADDFSNPNAMSQKSKNMDPPAVAAPTFGPKSQSSGSFYFYNPQTVAFGKIEFKKKWGNRAYKNNWRLSMDQIKGANASDDEPEIVEIESKTESEAIAEANPKYTVGFYINQLPKSAKAVDSLSRERNFAYYQLGVIYKEKFKEYELAASKLESLLNHSPEERLILPAMYNLFKIYEIINNDKALTMKNSIIQKYPNSRYAQILSNSSANNDLANQSPDAIYEKLYYWYEKRDYFKVLNQTTKAIDQLAGEEIVPKLELLKANVVGKLKGLEEFKTALNYVALSYPNVFEGKEAEKLLQKDIPILEKLKFYDVKPDSWKIIYKYTSNDSLKLKPIVDKIKKFAIERTAEKLYFSQDIYTMTESFMVIHGAKSESNAKDIATILRDYKDYNIKENAIVISNENYKIVQIKKNLPEYLTTAKTDPVAQKAYVPEPTKIVTDNITPVKSQSRSKMPPAGSVDMSDDPKPIMNSSNPPQKPVKKD